MQAFAPLARLPGGRLISLPKGQQFTVTELSSEQRPMALSGSTVGILPRQPPKLELSGKIAG